ncbi:TPA: NAD(P)-binding domain-containing protein [Kluyvera intermedia]|uniref:FAD-dependent oxidoreductase n=2 Tax=Enterobacteriaceae TaxID=543 RepID=A0AAC8QPH4_9ENTR|nr:NAD(P)/FAD-dependent oxidoreductase [Phytobacter ursingii]HAT2204743.1 NAD(P)-binding domain-containing protein [Kluyvera intermedia]AKL12362.1 FAD-dependent oxidoreductase [Phytobacter ursingii]HAT2515304.1 NAD(P)-binding domain-containing protein [Kluyvera intermedia]HAT2603069.1 NAD(P)-binding domain-containing protein [Kluyvera intermedia]HAT2679937.1 NAD(P)-binding domain-containing protein [Kluyvera intermedia]
MSAEKINTVIVGAGQAGIAMSEHLALMGVPHVVLERSRIAERWRSERWDSLVANGPAWHDRFPSLKFDNISQEAFPPKERMAQYFEDYAQMINAPVRTGVEVHQVTRLAGRSGFNVLTSAGEFEADNVVAATGPFQKPSFPQIVPESAGVHQIHSSVYKNPHQLPEGAVLVVGAGASGTQIAEELRQSGRDVYLSVGEHYRPPRTYRDRDYCWWLGALGLWDEVKIKPKKEHVAFAVSGYEGGKTVDFRRLAHTGITLVGITKGWDNGVLSFAGGLAENIAAGDSAYFDVLRDADAYIERNGLDLPPEPQAWELLPDPEYLLNPLTQLDIAAAGITTIIWATGFKFDFGWLNVDAFDEKGLPFHKRGISAERGIYFLGLPNLVNRASSFIYGVWHDAKYIADHIVLQNAYTDYVKS